MEEETEDTVDDIGLTLYLAVSHTERIHVQGAKELAIPAGTRNYIGLRTQPQDALQRFSWFNTELNNACLLKIQWTPEAALRFMLSSPPRLQRMYYPNTKEDYGVYHLHTSISLENEPGVQLKWIGSLEFVDRTA